MMVKVVMSKSLVHQSSVWLSGPRDTRRRTVVAASLHNILIVAQIFDHLTDDLATL